MMNARQKQQRQRAARRSSPSNRSRSMLSRNAVSQTRGISSTPLSSVGHALVNHAENESLYAYENRIKASFDHIVPTLKKISSMQYETDFVNKAQTVAQQDLGYLLPQEILEDAWVQQLDMKKLFAWCVFETYHRFSDDFYTQDPLGSSNENDFSLLMKDCGFHTLDVTPCADGRLAHVIRYVLRLPYRSVRRRSYAGALFDINDSLDKWVEVELKRYREGKPDSVDSMSQYLKVVVYHFSSVDPEHEGCAAHGSDTVKAAEAGAEKLIAFKQAIENTHCCGASVELLLIGLDTDTDAIRVHMSDSDGGINLESFIDSADVFRQSIGLGADAVKQNIAAALDSSSMMSEGKKKFVTYLIGNNLSQIEYVNKYHNKNYSDIGHAERFIGAGIGFEEVQLRNLMYFAYLNTVEEATQDLDVGIKIFTHLNIKHGLPVPVVVRFDYHGQVPGSKDRAIEQCKRVSNAINERFSDLKEQGNLHSMLAVRDVNVSGKIEVLSCSVNEDLNKGAH